MSVVSFGQIPHVGGQPSRNTKHWSRHGIVADMSLGVVGRPVDLDCPYLLHDVRVKQCRRVWLVAGEWMHELGQRAEQCIESGSRVVLEAGEQSLECAVVTVVGWSHLVVACYGDEYGQPD